MNRIVRFVATLALLLALAVPSLVQAQGDSTKPAPPAAAAGHSKAAANADRIVSIRDGRLDGEKELRDRHAVALPHA